MILASFLRVVLSICCYIFENCEIVKISTTLEPQLDFQGLAGFVSVGLLLFLGDWFLDGFGDGFFVILEWIWGAFWLPKSIKKVIEFGIDF